MEILISLNLYGDTSYLDIRLLLSFILAASLHVNDGPPVDEPRMTKDDALDPPSDVSKQETQRFNEIGNSSENNKNNQDANTKAKYGKQSGLCIVHVAKIPLGNDFDSVNEKFGTFGQIKEIRMRLTKSRWEAWLTYSNNDSALNACCNVTSALNNSEVTGALCDRAPLNTDVYKPAEMSLKSRNYDETVIRTPKPPRWILVYGKEEGFNFFKVSKFLQRKVGLINSRDIYRFSRKSILIHAKSETQSHMLTNMVIRETDMIKDVKPHLSFSYGRGVIFDRDLYEFNEDEILDMCPNNVWKVKKIPRTSMIILTFEEPDAPSHVVIENVRLSVRVYKQKPLQCYNCLKFGHHSNDCKEDSLCLNCSAPEHGECNRMAKCANCDGNHKSLNRDCGEYKTEEAALLKARVEHITVGTAKKLLGKQLNYAKAVVNKQTLAQNAQTSNRARNKDSRDVRQLIPPATGDKTNVVEVLEQGPKPPPSKVGAKLPPKAATPPSEAGISLLDEILPAPLDPDETELSQAESLPDLMEQNQAPKRVRSPSSSPPPDRRRGSCPKTIEAEVYLPPKNKRPPKKPSLDRPKHQPVKNIPNKKDFIRKDKQK